MKRWHLTLSLALLAFGGVALSAGLAPLAGVAWSLSGGEDAAVSEVAAPLPVAAPGVATVVVDEIATHPAPPPDPATAATLAPARPAPPPSTEPVHPLHVRVPDPPPVSAIPETHAPRPPVRALPPDPPPPISPDYCPPCGRG